MSSYGRILKLCRRIEKRGSCIGNEKEPAESLGTSCEMANPHPEGRFYCCSVNHGSYSPCHEAGSDEATLNPSNNLTHNTAARAATLPRITI